MISLFLECLALISALSALVLAVLWPHARPFIEKFILSPLSAFCSRLTWLKSIMNQEEEAEAFGHKQPALLRAHPRFTGRPLKRVTSDKEHSLRSAYRSLDGFGQSPLTGVTNQQPSFAMPTNPMASIAGGYPAHAAAATYQQLGSRQSTTSISLSIFTATVIAIIIYTLMKMLSARFGQPSARRHLSDTRRGRRVSDGQFSGTKSGLGGSPFNTDDLYARESSPDLRRDKRKFARLSRDEKARELLRRHGGKNVASAIRFLVGEMEKEKRLILEKLLLSETKAENRPPSCCSCHCSATYRDEGELSESSVGKAHVDSDKQTG